MCKVISVWNLQFSKEVFHSLKKYLLSNSVCWILFWELGMQKLAKQSPCPRQLTMLFGETEINE